MTKHYIPAENLVKIYTLSQKGHTGSALDERFNLNVGSTARVIRILHGYLDHSHTGKIYGN